MRKASKKDNIITVYIKDINQSYSEIAVLTDCSVNYVEQCIRNYHTDLVAYYDICLTSSLIDPHVYFLFSDNGAEKKLKFENNKVISFDKLTSLEMLYVSLNLSRNIFDVVEDRFVFTHRF